MRKRMSLSLISVCCLLLSAAPAGLTQAVAANPSIGSISPEAALAGDDLVSVIITGSNFQNGCRVRVDGSPTPTFFLNATELEAVIPPSATQRPGNHLVSVENPGGGVSNSVAFAVLAAVGINEFLADPPDGPAGDANGDGVRSASQDEFVEIVNRTAAPIDVSGFSVRDNDATRFVFPPGALIPPFEAAVIFGGGSPRGDFGNASANGLVFVAPLSLNNTGDTLTLKDAAGAAIETVTYGSAEGNSNQSANRSADIFGGRFVLHSTVPGSSGRLFSPGTQVNGSPFTTAPRITAIAPDHAPQSSHAFDISIQGSGFNAASMALIDSAPVDTRFVSPSALVATVPPAVAATAGPHSVEVRERGGNRSNSQTLTIIPPPPSLQALLPRVVVAGAGGVNLFVVGENFDAGATVLVDGSPIVTATVSARQLRATVPATLTSAIATRDVRVRNGDGQESNALSLEVASPIARINALTPSETVAGAALFTLTVAGSNFRSGMAIVFDQSRLDTTFVSASRLQASVPAQLVAGVGLKAVAVVNADGALSNEAVFRVAPDPPLITSIDPLAVIEGAGDVKLSVAGQKFQRGTRLHFFRSGAGEADADATFISANRLEAVMPAAFIERAGDVFIRAENPDAGASNAARLRVLIRDPVVINEFLADPPDGLAGDANGDGVRSSSQDEFVEIVNRTAEPIDVSGYRLADADAVRHIFAAGTVIPPFEAAVVFGGGSPRGDFGNAAENRLVMRASTGGLSLNNTGDAIRLEDAEGRIIQEIRFGPAEGGAGQSINRDPDVDGATFSLHTSVAPGRLFSPGTKAAGAAFTIKPRVGRIEPASVRVGSADFSITVSGSNFLPGATVMFGQSRLATSYHSDMLLEAVVPASEVAEGGAAEVRVVNPRGELSGALKFLIIDDPPHLSRLTPQKTGTGAADFELTISGERFQRGCRVMVAGAVVEARLAGATSIVARVPDRLFERAAELEVRVTNADGNVSNALTFAVENGPLITRLSRSRVRAGSGEVELKVGGVAFKPDVVLFVNETAVETRYGGETEITARVPAAMTSAAGVLSLQARHADGGRSNKVALRVVE